MVLHFSQLRGTELKKIVNAKRVAKRYHNKNSSGGNFGIDIRLQNDEYFELTGYYNTKDEVYSMHFGKGYNLGEHIIRRDNYQEFTFEDLKRILTLQLGIAPAPAQRDIPDRNRGAEITDINGIKFVDFTVSGGVRDMDDIRAEAKNSVRRNADKLKRAGFNRVEFDSIGGFSHRNISRGRFIQVTTMHNLRLMKR